MEVQEAGAIAGLLRQYRFDAILLDDGLQTANGEKVIDWIRAAADLPAVPVIALSASEAPETGDGAAVGGNSPRLSRPVDVDALSETLARCTGHRLGIEEAVLGAKAELSSAAMLAGRKGRGFGALSGDADREGGRATRP